MKARVLDVLQKSSSQDFLSGKLFFILDNCIQEERVLYMNVRNVQSNSATTIFFHKFIDLKNKQTNRIRRFQTKLR